MKNQRFVRMLAAIFTSLLLMSALAVPAAAAPGSGPGRIVVNHDEWTLSDTGFSQQPASAAAFALNVAHWFTGGDTGNFLVYSANFGLTQNSFLNTLTSAGHSVTVSTSIPFTLANLQQYDGVFLAGTPADNTVLTDYVNAGGNVYVAGGTGWHNNEHLLWNSFLNAFGLGYTWPYNGICCNVGGLSSHPITAGVSQLYYWNGNTVVKLNPADPHVQIVASHSGMGMIGVYEGGCDPYLNWKSPLSDSAAYNLSNGDTLPIAFRWGTCDQFLHDESVVVVVTDQANPGYPITVHVYGYYVEIDDAAAEYRVEFASGDYWLSPGAVLEVQVYMSDVLVGSALVNIVP